MTTLYTFGHSARTVGAFIATLATAGVERLIDVRARPASRRHPQYNRSALAEALEHAGIAYEWWGERLGGFRSPRSDSPHLALEGAFKGFADHMASAEFQDAIRELLAAPRPTAVMCAERNPEECHRSLIADALLVGGARVEHLIEAGVSRTASVSAVARVDGGRLIYDRGAQPRLLD